MPKLKVHLLLSSSWRLLEQNRREDDANWAAGTAGWGRANARRNRPRGWWTRRETRSITRIWDPLIFCQSFWTLQFGYHLISLIISFQFLIYACAFQTIPFDLSHSSHHSFKAVVPFANILQFQNTPIFIMTAALSCLCQCIIKLFHFESLEKKTRNFLLFFQYDGECTRK